jgi:hypothetical protein
MTIRRKVISLQARTHKSRLIEVALLCPLYPGSDQIPHRSEMTRQKPTSRLSMRMRLGRSHNGLRPPWVSTFERRVNQVDQQSNRNCLGAARLVCMMEVSDLPNPVAGCWRRLEMRMLRCNAFGMGLGKKPQRQKNGRLRPCTI